MKKLLIAAMMMFLGGAYIIYAGESYSVPTADVSNPINADYGGVDIWYSTFSAVVSTVALPGGQWNVPPIQNPAGTYGKYASTTTPNLNTQWRVYGVLFSTGACGDSVDIFASTGAFPGASSAPYARVYNFNNSTGAVVIGGTCSGVTPGPAGFRFPIRLYGNIFLRPSNANYNSIGLMYWKQPD